MNYELIPSKYFLDQLKYLDESTLSILEKKLNLLSKNPFRNKKLEGWRFLFRIRFKDKRKEKRLIYRVDKNKVKIICILDRNNDYKDLRDFLNRFGM